MTVTEAVFELVWIQAVALNGQEMIRTCACCSRSRLGKLGGHPWGSLFLQVQAFIGQQSNVDRVAGYQNHRN